MMTNASRINNEALVNVAGGDYWDGDTYWTDASSVIFRCRKDRGRSSF